MTYLERLKLNRDIRNYRMKWGVRRYQNDDGTLTEEAKKRYMAKENMLKNESKDENQE